MAKHVQDLMTLGVNTARSTQSLADAAEMMKRDDIGSLPVVESGRLVGILTDRDIVTRAVAEGRDPHAVIVDDVASHDVVTVRPDEDLSAALELMAAYQLRRLPVVEEGHLVGMLAQADVALEAKEKQVGELVGKISKP